MFIILYGIQGSGKGTQGQLLSRKLGIPHVSTGEILRTLALQQTDEGRKLKDQLEKGEYLSDERMTAILQLHLPEHVILDGYPRTLSQAKLLDKIARVDAVVYIDLHEEEAKKRALSRGRADDTPEAIHRRMQQYHAEADAILLYYQEQGKLRSVDGDQAVHAVFSSLCTELGI